MMKEEERKEFLTKMEKRRVEQRKLVEEWSKGKPAETKKESQSGEDLTSID